jgi:CheY-like chemotaxis protein
MTEIQHHIMVVDDEDDIRFTLQALLSGREYRVTIACDGQECLDWISKNAKDLPHTIILDVMMPRLNGVKVARMLKGHEKTKHIPIIMLTGCNDKKQQRAALMELKVEYYLTKPFDPDQLLEKVETAVKYRVRP